ncbi:MAG: TolC family protein [Gammaproteobacteria bacterium]|nr:TolC family protein [Gammaproteobacteria bacterium]MDE0248173.1 TolC family protein [Gammaproteobacteria bacterium]
MKARLAGTALIGLLQAVHLGVPDPAAARAVQDAALEGPPVRRITLDEALGLLGANLEFRIAHRVAAEAEALTLASAAYPNPTVSATHEALEAVGLRQSESYFTLSQRVEWPSLREARRTAASGRAAAARHRVAADSAALAFRVKSAYVHAARAEREARTLERVVAVFRRAGSSMEARFAEGDASLYEMRRVEVERVRYEAALADALVELAATQRELALLVAPGADDLRLAPAEPPVGMPPTVDPGDLAGPALARRAEVAASESEVRALEAELRRSRALRLPELTASGGYKRQSDGFGGLFLGMSLPLPLWNRSAGEIQAAAERVTAEETRLALTRREVEEDVRAALAEHRSHLRSAALLTRPGAGGQADLLSIAEVAYETGGMDLAGLLDAAEALSGAEAAVARMEAELWIGYYNLERAAGGFGGAVHAVEEEE